jgi:hypothetical protein
MADLRKMGFWEIGKNTKNSLVKKVQALFEQAQIEAIEKCGTTAVTLKIFIKPPDSEQDARFGKTWFKTHMSVPAEESKEFTTELVDGCIVGNGTSELDILQCQLEFPELAAPDNIEEFTRAAGTAQQH